MPTALPVIRGASAALYPFTLTVSFDTVVQQFESAAQQRWARRAGLAKFELNWGALTQAQKNTLKAAHTSAKGGFDAGLTLALGVTTYSGLSFDEDEFAAVESTNLQYDAKLHLSQTISGVFTPGTPSAAFPTLANGSKGIKPYTQKKRFQTLVSKMAAGPKYTYAQFAGGLTGFPTDGLLGWEMDEKQLSEADAGTQIQHFIDNYGRLYGFTFVDEEGNTNSNVHYAMDEMVITFTGLNNIALKISLEQTN